MPQHGFQHVLLEGELFDFPVGKFGRLEHRQRDHLCTVANQDRPLFLIAFHRELDAAFYIEAVDLLHCVVTPPGIRTYPGGRFRTRHCRGHRAGSPSRSLFRSWGNGRHILRFRHGKIICPQQLQDAANRLKRLILLRGNLRRVLGNVSGNSFVRNFACFFALCRNWLMQRFRGDCDNCFTISRAAVCHRRRGWLRLVGAQQLGNGGGFLGLQVQVRSERVQNSLRGLHARTLQHGLNRLPGRGDGELRQLTIGDGGILQQPRQQLGAKILRRNQVVEHFPRSLRIGSRNQRSLFIPTRQS